MSQDDSALYAIEASFGQKMQLIIALKLVC